MLVLSRKASEEVVFPALGVSIRVIRISGNTVKLGFEAPSSLKIMRGENLGYSKLIESLKQIGNQIEHHDLRGRLNSAVLNLEVLTASAARGIAIDETKILQRVMHQLDGLEEELVQQAQPISGDIKTSATLPRLLIVDDNPNERELLSSVLAIQGFSVESVGDGTEALQNLNCKELPQAVLLDMNMPKLSGEKTLRCIRSDYRLRKLRVIGISGKQPTDLGLPDGMPGFDGWFNKPLDLARLVKLIHESSETCVSHS